MADGLTESVQRLQEIAAALERAIPAGSREDFNTRSVAALMTVVGETILRVVALEERVARLEGQARNTDRTA